MKKTRRKRSSVKTSLTPEHDQLIQAEYLITPIKRLADKIGRSQTVVKTRLRQLGLEIPREVIEQRKIDSRIKPGNVPANKGKKLDEYVSPETAAKIRQTAFKKGNKPANTIGIIGTITLRRHNKKGRVLLSKWILVAENKWKELKHYVWEQHNDPVAKGYRLRFIDGDPLNCEIENLELITITENMKRNSVHNLPEDLRQIVQLKGALNRQINKKRKP